MTQRRPAELKAISGTTRPDRDVSNISSLLPMLEVVPSPPDWLTHPAAVREWTRLAPQLVACGVMRATMLSSLAHLCQVHAALLDGYKSAEPPKAALLAAYTRMAGLFGLTAVDARRLPSPERGAKRSKYGQFKGMP